MKTICLAAVAGAALLASGCGAAPEKSIAQDCMRLDMLSGMPGAGDEKKTCACFAGKLKTDMSKENLKALAKTLKKSKSESDFEAAASKAGLSDSASMVMMGAAKSCVMAS